jgi:hypothetical protein
VRDDAEPVLVDEQVPVPERPALRPAHRPPRREIKSISTSKNTSKKGNKKQKREEGGREVNYRNLPMVDSWEGRSSLPGFLIGGLLWLAGLGEETRREDGGESGARSRCCCCSVLCWLVVFVHLRLRPAFSRIDFSSLSNCWL